MAKLSGVVAVLNADGTIAEYRDLGPDPVEVKEGRVVPVNDQRPTLKSGEVYDGFDVTIVDGVVVRAWQAVVPPPDPPSLDDRVAALEARIAGLEQRA